VHQCVQDKFEDTKGVIKKKLKAKIRRSKEQTMISKTPHRTPMIREDRTPLKCGVHQCASDKLEDTRG
jgi:hypothetical protein